MGARVELLSRPGCHLCDDAREEFREVDITADPELLEQYAEQIPVVFVDGEQHDFWHVDPRRLRMALTS
jgi:glutaredoxin